MEEIKKEEREGITFLSMSIDDAIEIILFTFFLAATLGAVFRQKFIYVIFAAIVIFAWIEMFHRRSSKRQEEKKNKRKQHII
jgi:uncharacterized membrane protein YfcA